MTWLDGPCWDCGRIRFDLDARVLVMGVLNVTPDSFSDGGQYHDPNAAIERALAMISEGADIVDIGGESTRPGAEPTPAEREAERVVPVIAALRARAGIPISIDTSKAAVARAALDAGADIVNDVSGLLADAAMTPLVAGRGCGVVAMHRQGSPRDMQTAPHYRDVVAEVRAFYEERLAALRQAGVAPGRVLLDPGIGFGKTVEHNLDLIANLGALEQDLRPQLLGVSRKSFIGKTLGGLDVADRLEGTAAAVAVCAWNGAACLRVHDIRAMRRVCDMTQALRLARRGLGRGGAV